MKISVTAVPILATYGEVTKTMTAEDRGTVIDEVIRYLRTERKKNTLRLECGIAPHEELEKYDERSDKRENPYQFFKRVYRPSGRRRITQSAMRRFDRKWYDNFHSWCHYHGHDPDKLVPASRWVANKKK